MKKEERIKNRKEELKKYYPYVNGKLCDFYAHTRLKFERFEKTWLLELKLSNLNHPDNYRNTQVLT